MNDIKQLPAALTKTIENENIQDSIVDFSESSLDFFLNDGLLRDIPIIGSIYNLSKAVITIQDRLFIKKIIS